MKVSLVHPERRCAQHLVLDLITPVMLPDFPSKLLQTQRYEFTMPRGALLAFVASAVIKPPASAESFGDLNGLLGPLVIELEAEEGETLHDNLVRVFRLDARGAALVAGDSAAFMNLTDADFADLDALVPVPAPITRAGDRQQFGMLTLLVHPERDLLIALAPGAQE